MKKGVSGDSKSEQGKKRKEVMKGKMGSRQKKEIERVLWNGGGDSAGKSSD